MLQKRIRRLYLTRVFSVLLLLLIGFFWGYLFAYNSVLKLAVDIVRELGLEEEIITAIKLRYGSG